MNIWIKILLVGASGGLGAIARYLIMLALHTNADNLDALSTWVINSIACFLIGIFAGWLIVCPWSETAKSIFMVTLMTGFCGGFSTFSAFTLDCIKYFEAGQIMTWLVFAALTIFVGLFSCALGYWLGQQL